MLSIGQSLHPTPYPLPIPQQVQFGRFILLIAILASQATALIQPFPFLSLLSARFPKSQIRILQPTVHSEPIIRPKDRVAVIREQIETTLERQKVVDHHWDDLVDVSPINIINLPASYLFQNPYQSPLFPYASKFFKFTSPPEAPSWPSSASDETEVNSSTPNVIRQPHAVHMRYGRGGRVHLACQISVPRSFSRRLQCSSQFTLEEENEDEDEDPEGKEQYRRLEERWRFDWDDLPLIGPEGVEENDRFLVDDYDTMYVLFMLSTF
jgi:enhancer of polycomb-like protein